MMNSSASQNGGTEIPAKHSRLTAVSVTELGRRAAWTPKGIAMASESTSDTLSSSSVLSRRGSNTSSTGWDTILE